MALALPSQTLPVPPLASQSDPRPSDPLMETTETEKEFIKTWEGRATKAKAKWEADFKRMKKNMEFVTGYQWDGQNELDDPRYSNNLVQKVVNQKVATLYARNPTVEITRRKRMDFSIWDGSVAMLQEAKMTIAMAQQAGQTHLPSMALLQDYQQGMQRRQLTERFGQTLQCLIQYFLDNPSANFKENLKQAVKRAIICGVAFGRAIYTVPSREDPQAISTQSIPHSSTDLAARAQALIKSLEDSPSGEQDPRHAELISYAKSLAASLGAVASGTDDEPLPEYIEFDFPLATSVYPDTSCRSLTNFSGASAVFIESVLPVDFVNALFKKEVKVGSGTGAAKSFSNDGEESRPGEQHFKDNLSTKGNVCVLEVLNLRDKTHFFICKGWREFLLSPEPFQPPVNGFWPIAALTFNSIEVDPSTKTSVFPPSDVQSLKSIQKEWNRIGNSLRDQRNANAPCYIVRKGMLSDADKESLSKREPNQVIELDSIPADQSPANFISILQVAKIDGAVYDKAPLEKDLQYSSGLQEANIGPAKANVTATVGSIAEQSRITTAASNIDDLDNFLSTLVRFATEMAVRAMSIETVKTIVGPGAVWPTTPEARKSLLNEIDITIKAASSGRPNKALEIQNARELGPLIVNAINAASTNPLMVKPMSALVEEYVRRLDDQIDVTKFFPVAPPPLPPGAQQSPSPSGPPNRSRNNNGAKTQTGAPIPRGPGGPGVPVNNQQ